MALVPVGVDGPQIHLIDGTYFHFDDPDRSSFSIFGIAHALSMLCRFTGHVNEFYSVAQHSVGVSHLVPEELALPALLHDAGEAFINDLSSPLKHHADMQGYRDIEKRVEESVFRKFGVSDYLLPMHRHIKHADLVMLATEQRDLMPPSDAEWAVLRGRAPRPERICPLLPAEAKELFLARYMDLAGCRP